MPVQKCERDGLPGWQYGDGGRCYTYKPGDESASNEAKRRAYVQGYAITRNTGEELKGLYLVAPQGRMIYNGIKTAIAKPKLDTELHGKFMLVSKEDGTGLAFGEIVIGEPYQVSAVAFKDYFNSHQVSEADRMRWWQDATPLFVYPISHFEKYVTPLLVDVPPGVQMVMESVDLKSFIVPEEFREMLGDTVTLEELKAEQGTCVCPECGATMPHEIGVPRTDTPCPKCEAAMVRDNKAVFPLADRSRPWDVDAAVSRLRRYADAEDAPNAKYRGYFMYWDPDKKNLFTGGKFPYVDIIDGEPHAIPHALSNILSRLPGSTIPDSAKDEVRRKVESYQSRLKECEDDEDKKAVCPECGAELDDESTECAACGAQIERGLVTQTATQLGSQIKEDNEEVGEKATSQEDEPVLVNNALDAETPDTETKQRTPEPVEGEYLFAKRTWIANHPSATSNVVGAKPLKVAFDLFIKSANNVRYSITGGAPPSPITITPAEMAPVIDVSDKKYDPMGIPDQLDIKQGTLYNQNGPAKMVVVERGTVTVESNDEERKYTFSGPRFAGTWVVKETNSGWMMEQGEKAGRRVQEAKLAVVTRAARRLKELLGIVQGEVIDPLEDFKKWALYEDETVEQAMEHAPRSILDLLSSRKDFSRGAAFAFKAVDGTDWWMQWTTNAFIDREKEIFTTKAIEDYVDRHSSDDAKGEFWFWHIPGSKFATVKWQAVVGRFLVQAGPFDDTKVGNAFKELFTKYPDGHETVAPHGWGTSHGYYYSEEDRDDGIYEVFEIKESTVLPWHRAANQFSPAPRIIQEGNKMNDEQRKGLVDFAGEEIAAEIEDEGSKLTKDLEERGVDFKEKAEVTPDETPEVKEEVAEEVEETKEIEVKETPQYLTQDALIEAVKLVTETLRTEMQTLSQSIDTRIESLKQSQEREAEEIKEQIQETPAASLSDLLRSAIGTKQTRISEKEAEELGAPKETEAKKDGPFFMEWTH